MPTETRRSAQTQKRHDRHASRGGSRDTGKRSQFSAMQQEQQRQEGPPGGEGSTRGARRPGKGWTSTTPGRETLTPSGCGGLGWMNGWRERWGGRIDERAAAE